MRKSRKRRAAEELRSLLGYVVLIALGSLAVTIWPESRMDAVIFLVGNLVAYVVLGLLLDVFFTPESELPSG